MNKSPIFLAMMLALYTSLSQQLETECTSFTDQVKVVSDADIVIGAILSVHDPGKGVYGCGVSNAEGIAIFEAMRWTISVLNQDNGFINGVPVTDSFIPGIKLGLLVYDNCGHQDLAIHQLAKIFPVIKSGSSSCSLISNASTPILGIIDQSGLISIDQIAEVLHEYNLPYAPIHYPHVSSDYLAKAMLQMVTFLQWEQVAIVYEDDHYSKKTIKLLESQLCVSLTLILPDESKSLRKIVTQLTTRLKGHSSVLVIAQGKALKDLLDAISEDIDAASRLQFLFSWVPPLVSSPSLYRLMNASRVYSIGPHPSTIKELENYWSRMKDPAVLMDQNDNVWFQDYLTQLKGCRDCMNVAIHDTESNIFYRTSRVLPSISALFSFAHAMRELWIDKCNGSSGFCEMLHQTSRREFLFGYLQKVEFRHNPKDRSPSDIDGLKTQDIQIGEMSNCKLTLNLYNTVAESSSEYIIHQEIALYENDNLTILKPDFRSIPSPCPKLGCNHCTTSRKARVDGLSEPSTSEIVVLGAPEDVRIIVVVPIHQSGTNALDCSSKIQPAAVESLEAILWSIDFINNNQTYLPGVTLSAVVIDTCSSSLRLTHQLITYLTDKTDLNGKVKLESAVGVISVGDTNEAEAASEVLSTLNVTSITSEDRGQKRDPYTLQVSIDVTSTARAVAEVLQYLGWTYVSVLYDDENFTGFLAFRDESRKRGICLALEHQLKNSNLLGKVESAQSRGAQVVVLWTSSASTKTVLQTLSNASEIVWVGAGTFVHEPLSEIWTIYEKQLSGRTFLFKTRDSNSQHFNSYFEHLRPESSKNPWLNEYWNLRNCTELGCRKPLHSVINVIRATSSLVSGLAHLRSEACRSERGLCPTLMQHRQLRQLLNLYIRRPSARFDDLQDVFGFTGDGSGDLPVGIYSIQRTKDTWPFFKKVGSYQNGLKSLAGMTTEKEVTSECLSECSYCLGRRSDYLITASEDQLYLAAALTIHGSAKNPLDCGKLIGIQQVEAFLWALDQVNSDHDLLNGLQLGGVIIDTCGSREKVSRDVANLFTQYPNQIYLPPSDHITGFLIGKPSNLVQPITDVTMPLTVPTITSATSTVYEDADAYPYLLRTGVSNRVFAESLVELLKHFKWKYVSVVYNNDQGDLYKTFSDLSEQQNIKTVFIEALPGYLGSNSNKTFDNAVHRLVSQTQKGSRVVILFLNEYTMDGLMYSANYWLQKELYAQGDIVWISLNNLENFRSLPAAVGSLSVVQPVKFIPDFLKYFQNLDISNNSRNPWFQEYWGLVHNCRGAACYSGLKETVHREIQQDLSISAIVNSVFLFAQGLRSLRKTLCPGNLEAPCQEMFGSDARKLLYTLCIFAADLDNTTTYRNQRLRISNLQKRSDDHLRLVDVGTFSEAEGLVMNKAKTYRDNKEIDLKTISSVYFDEWKLKPAESSKRNQYMEILSERPWIIQFLMPVHSAGTTIFSCGEITDWSFQAITGILHSLEKANMNAKPWQKIGAIVFDTCGRHQRAQEQVFNLFGSEKDAYETKPQKIITAITFGEELANEISTVLESIDVAQVVIPTSFVTEYSAPPFTYRILPTNQGHAQVLSALISNYGWNSVYVLYSSSSKGQKLYTEFEDLVGKSCIAKSVILHPGNSANDIISLLDEILDDMSIEITILMIDEVYLARNVIWAARRINRLENMMWLETEGWADHPSVQDVLVGSVKFLSIRVANPTLPGFKEFHSNYSLLKNEYIPVDWFHDMWQNEFQCKLDDTLSSLNQYPKSCDGTEGIRKTKFLQNRVVSHISHAVEIVIKSLLRFFERNCNQTEFVLDLDECSTNPRVLFAQELEKELKSDFRYDLNILEKTGEGHYTYVKIGSWISGNLSISSKAMKHNLCIKNCHKCGSNITHNSSGSESFPFHETQPLFTFIRTLPNVIFTALASLGIVLVTICALYFLATFSVSVGTTVLGYTILVGLVLLYASNFVFILEPVPIVCGLRRFVMGFAYSIIYAGMLVKVMNTWRMMGYQGNGMTEDNSRVPGSSGLLVIALGLVTIQVILLASWLVLMPPKVTVYNNKWQCEPVTTFEKELLVSHTYVFLLLFVAIIFGFVTCRCNDNQNEARWILGACLISAGIWIAWPLVTLYLPVNYRVHVVIASNLLSASITMICLYIRKIYIYGQLRRQARDREIKARLHPNGQIRPTYGAAIHPRETVTRGVQVRRIDMDEDGIVQVQASDLYPLDMYEGGYHFPLPGRRSVQRKR